MHYFDPEHLDSNILKLVVYTHESEYGCSPDVTSIQYCKYFSPRILKNIIEHPDCYIGRKHIPELERWYLITFKQTSEEDSDFEIIDVEDVTDSNNEFYRLH